MTFLRQYSIILAVFVFVGIIVLLLSSSDLIFSSGVTFIDTELNRSSGDETYVRTKMDFGSQAHMSKFPRTIGNWTGSDYDATKWIEELGADIILMRWYTLQTLSQPVSLLIMQAKTSSSFHPPSVCYPAQGYVIQEKSKDSVLITNTSWAESSTNSSISVNKLIVNKESETGDIIERRVVLYCYVKGNQFTTDTITMIRTEALAPISGPYEESLVIQKQFLNQAIPRMFEPANHKNWHPIILELTSWGIAGYVIVIVLICIPLIILILPRTRWGKIMPV